MSDWSKRSAKRFLEKGEADKTQIQWALQEEKLLNQESGRRWDELRNLLMAKSGEFNAEPGMEGTLTYDSSNTTAITVKNVKDRSSVRLEFRKELNEVAVSRPVDQVFKIGVLRGSRDVGFVDADGNWLVTEKIATDILDQLLRLGDG